MEPARAQRQLSTGGDRRKRETEKRRCVTRKRECTFEVYWPGVTDSSRFQVSLKNPTWLNFWSNYFRLNKHPTAESAPRRSFTVAGDPNAADCRSLPPFRSMNILSFRQSISNPRTFLSLWDLSPGLSKIFEIPRWERIEFNVSHFVFNERCSYLWTKKKQI